MFASNLPLYVIFEEQKQQQIPFGDNSQKDRSRQPQGN